MKSIFLSTALFLSVIAFGQTAREINVTGEATKILTPDYAEISIEVSAENPSAETALKEMNTASSEAIDYLKKQKGIEKIQAQRLNINEVNRYNQQETKYMASQVICFRLTNFDLYEPVILKLFSLGVNGIQSINFNSTQRDAFEDELLKTALKNAKEKAILMATELGTDIGMVTYISDVASSAPTPINRMYTADAEFKSAITAPEEMTVSTQVQVRFLLK